MNKKLILKNIVQADNRGALMFSEPGTDPVPGAGGRPGTPGKPGITVAVQFTSAKEAAAYDQGEEYTITITKTKK